MSNYLPVASRESVRLFSEDVSRWGKRVCDASSRFAEYILNVYETLCGLAGWGAYHVGSGICRGACFSVRSAIHGGRVALKGARAAVQSIDKNAVGTVSGLCGYALYQTYSAIEFVALWIDDRVRMFFAMIRCGLERAANSVTNTVVSGAQLIARFVQNNWKQILAYLCAWGVVITSSGALYGFEAVALPLTIGFGAGVVAGGLAGILTIKIFDPHDQYHGRNTAWDLLNLGVGHLDPNGTRQIVLSISVTVLLAASVVFPYALGGVFGLLVGNQVITKIGAGRDLGPDPQEREHKLQILRDQLQEVQKQLSELGE